jgi:hypothetical protein
MRTWPWLLLALAACGRSDAARTTLSDSAAAPRIQPGTTAGASVVELWQLRPGLTLAEWKSTRPDETVTGPDSAGGLSALGTWCAGVQKQIVLGARTITRTAFFYPPAPTTLALPDSSADPLVLGCEIGLVWIRVEVADTSQARALADSLATQLRAAFGAPDAKPVNFFGAALWKKAARFHRGSVDVVTGLRPTSAPPDTSVRRPVVFAFAMLPVSGLSLDSLRQEAWQPPDTVPLDSAIALAHLDTSLSAPVRALASPAPGAPVRGQPPGALITPLQRWLQASASLPPARRAAALYVADEALERAMCAHRLCDEGDSTAQAPLRALGARFTWGQLGASWVYQRTWLDQARNLDRDSPLGQRIFLAQLAAAFDFSGVCGAGEEGFRRVIDNGERYLERLPDSPIAPAVHYEVAEAYRDIVALARGAAGDYADSSRYGAEAGPAAEKALRHYRAAMRAGPAADVARAAWRRAWQLKAGLNPRDVRFYCVYD